MLPNFGGTNLLAPHRMYRRRWPEGLVTARGRRSTKVCRRGARLTGARSATLAAMATLNVGDTAPDFEVADTDGQMHKLSQMVTRGPVILAFFPKAFTPG
jgi:hypothetical protein